MHKILLNILPILILFPVHFYGQDPKLKILSDNVLRFNGNEEKQNRHVAINDSFHRAKEFKTQWKYLEVIQRDCRNTMNKNLEAIVINSKGNFYLGTGNYISGIEAFNNAAHIFDSLGDFAGLSMVHANIGNAYFYVGDMDKALLYYKMAVSDYKKVKNKKPDSETKLANCYNSLGSIYCSKGDFVFGKTYFDLAYQIWQRHGDSLSIAYIMNNYANIHYENNKQDSALYYFNKALGMKLKHGDNYDKADAYNNLAQFYLTNKKPELTVDYSFKSLAFLDSNIYSRQLLSSYYHLSEAYRKLKDYRNELRYYKLYKIANDSSNVQVQKSTLSKIELKHEFDRVHLADSIKAVEEMKLKDAKLSEKKQQTYFLVFILILTVAVLGLIYSRFTLTKKQKLIIEQKNKEITDSINYARKIQQSILPNEKYIEKELNKLGKKS